MQRQWEKFFVAGCILLFLGLLAAFVVYEVRTSRFQAYYFSRVAKKLTFWMECGHSPSIRFPKSGPYDKRLGYVRLPAFIERLTAKGYKIEAQAHFSPHLLKMTERGLFTTYNEKTRVGLTILSHNSQPFFTASFPGRFYSDFNEIPHVIVRSLLFIENQELLNPRLPYLNPAVEWHRLAKAVILKGRHLMDRDERVPGASTLATQMEKYLHSPEGRTTSAKEKYRQMISATLRAYLNGEKTLETRYQIVLDYINSIPLGAIPGYGQVNGLGDGMYAWYGADFNYINRRLTGNSEGSDLKAWALAYKQVLSLFIAQRRPSFYLLEDNDALEVKTNSYIRLLADNGIISSEERDAALRVRLNVRQRMPAQRKVSFVERKAANAIRYSLLSLLEVPDLYELDLLDLTVKSTLDRYTQEEVTEVLRKLHEPAFAEAAGLRGSRLLESGDPGRVIYSFTLYESTPGANLLRIQSDNFDQPFNINEGIKLELGSSAKLRTLITYLEIVAALHNRYSGLPHEQLRSISIPAQDQLSKWAVDYLSNTADKSLKAMLETAMERRYSASPAEHFFTGGGRHTFSNFDDKYDKMVISVREAFHNSVNLVFVRLMRDIVRYYTFQRAGIVELLEDIKDPKRQFYLRQFADREGKVFLSRFYHKYQGKNFKEALDILLQNVSPRPSRLSVVFRSVRPEGGIEEFTSFMRSRLFDSQLSDRAIQKLYEDYSPEAYSLVDRGYIARIHPLELWTVAYLHRYPGADIAEIMEASAKERQEVYAWLFKTHRKNAQDIRILTLLEIEAFFEIHRAWKNMGYPFNSLVPSYATAIGSSADRPSSLAELVGVILNNGVWYPSLRIQELHFAKGTPYETLLKYQMGTGREVLLPEIASVVRGAMVGVVEKGTAMRVHRAFLRSEGTEIVVGGKTGTGDNRFNVYGPRGHLIKSIPINRTSVFVFFLGDRFFGTITAYVAGPQADNYKFSSLLPLQVLKALVPKLIPLIEKADINILDTTSLPLDCARRL